MDTQAVTPRVVRFGSFELDRRSGELRKEGVRVRLQEQPLRVLDALLADAGEPVTREALRQRLWPDDTFVGFESGLNRAINRLRAALGDEADNPRFIETLERRGYRFIAPVAVLAPPTQVRPPSAGEVTTVEPHRRGAAWLRAALAAGTLAAVLLTLALVLRRNARPSEAAGLRSLAVLPLANLTGDPGQEYFSDGMTDALITKLASLPGLHVISRQSVMRYKGSTKPLPEIARELGVEGVVEGSVVRSGGRVRITAQLMHAPTDRHLWGQSYERRLEDVLALQADIARAVVTQVQRHVGSVAAGLGGRPAAVVNPQAYELYLQGRFHLYQLNPASLARAVEHFEQVLALDPGFAQAHAGLASTRFMQEFWGGGRGFPNYGDQVRAAARKALALDPDLAEAHEVMGRALLHYDWDWSASEAEFTRAIELEPSLSSVYFGYSYLLQALARFDEAVAEAGKGAALDPRSPMALSEEGRALYRARRFGDAEDRYRRALELDPGFGPALDRLVQLHLVQGRLREAREGLNRLDALPSHRSRSRVSLRARLEAVSGNVAAARRLLPTSDTERPYAVTPHAEFHTVLGDHDAAFADLDRAVTTKVLLPYTWGNPELDPLRSDPRFARLVARMNLPVDRLVALAREPVVTSQARRAGERR